MYFGFFLSICMLCFSSSSSIFGVCFAWSFFLSPLLFFCLFSSYEHCLLYFLHLFEFCLLLTSASTSMLTSMVAVASFDEQFHWIYVQYLFLSWVFNFKASMICCSRRCWGDFTVDFLLIPPRYFTLPRLLSPLVFLLWLSLLLFYILRVFLRQWIGFLLSTTLSLRF